MIRKILVSLLFVSTANAGTYNFYINNAEQGDNSKATPTVVVGGEKSAQTPVQEGSANPSKPAPVQIPSGHETSNAALTQPGELQK